MSRSAEMARYESSVCVESKEMPGVRFEIARISLVRRADITRRVRTLLGELEYRSAGQELEDKLAAAHLEAAIDRVYIDWGLLSVEGLEIDGVPATVKSLVELGPEKLSHEAAAAIRKECFLTEDERKN